MNLFCVGGKNIFVCFGGVRILTVSNYRCPIGKSVPPERLGAMLSEACMIENACKI